MASLMPHPKPQAAQPDAVVQERAAATAAVVAAGQEATRQRAAHRAGMAVDRCAEDAQAAPVLWHKAHSKGFQHAINRHRMMYRRAHLPTGS